MRCKSWVDYRDYHKEREFMFNWLHPKQKEAKEEKKDLSSCSSRKSEINQEEVSY